MENKKKIKLNPKRNDFNFGWDFLVQVPRHSIAYLSAILSGYDNVGITRTLDSTNGIVGIICAKDSLNEAKRILKKMRKEVPLEFVDPNDLEGDLLTKFEPEE